MLRHAGGVRIDHIIGLFRLWWIPEGEAPTQGTYVRYDHEAMIGIVALEAHRAGALVVGEDLGTVEPWVRDYLRARGVLGTSILWFELDRDGNGGPLPAERWREYCLSSVTTHDLPPTAGYLAGEHVRLRDSLGLLTRPVDEELAAAQAERAAWIAELRRVGLLSKHGEEIPSRPFSPCIGTWAERRRGCWGVALTDAVGDRRTQNQPGTTDEYPNWRVPLSGPDGRPMLLEDVFSRSPGGHAGRGHARHRRPSARPRPPVSFVCHEDLEVRRGCPGRRRVSPQTRGGWCAFARHLEACGFESIIAVEHTVLATRYDSVYPYDRSGRVELAADCPVPDPLDLLSFSGRPHRPARVGHRGSGAAQSPSGGVGQTGGDRRCALRRKASAVRRRRLAAGRDRGLRHRIRKPRPARRRAVGCAAGAVGPTGREGVTYHGEFFGSTTSSASPKPVAGQQLPVHIGGHSKAAARRAGRFGDGFQPLGVTGAQLASLLDADA